ncbi:hypothetical protein FRC08_017396 [Ceratobasidium sp. 394]|nr:hypothetical protein FRC08_017396 [Ceratobasidium sp. 394]
MAFACDTGRFIITLKFSAAEMDEDTAVRMLGKAQETDRQRRLIEKLGPTRNAIKTILGIASAAAELHPIAKMALGICNQAWAKLEAQEQCDASVESLIDGLPIILPYVEMVKRATRRGSSSNINSTAVLYKLSKYWPDRQLKDRWII